MKAVTARSRPLDRLPTRDDARAIGERTKRAVRRPRTASDSRRRASYAGRRRGVELRPHTRRATRVRPPLRAHRALTQGSDSRDRSTCGSPRSVAPKRAASPYLHVRSGHLMTVSTRIGVPMSAPAAPIAEITGMKERAPLALDRPAASAFTRNRRLFGSCRWHFVSIRKSSPPSLTRASTSSAAPSHRRASSVTVAPRELTLEERGDQKLSDGALEIAGAVLVRAAISPASAVRVVRGLAQPAEHSSCGPESLAYRDRPRCADDGEQLSDCLPSARVSASI